MKYHFQAIAYLEKNGMYSLERSAKNGASFNIKERDEWSSLAEFLGNL